MIRFKVVDNRTKFAKKLKDMEAMLDGFYLNFLNGIADALIANSPVDTGNYITSFVCTQGRPTGETTSEGLPRHQDYEQFAAIGRAQLAEDIASLPPVDVSSKVYFVNRAEYADWVERYSYRGRMGEAPFTVVTRELNNIANDAAQRSL